MTTRCSDSGKAADAGASDTVAEVDSGATVPEPLARQVADAMFRRDLACHLLGIRVDSVAPGQARLSMTIRPDMVNGHGICHGGLIFTLADSAFAYACNSYNRNAVAAGCSIDFLAPGRVGEILVAECSEQAVAGRSGVYDTIVRNHSGATIALFRGKSMRIAGEVIGGLEHADAPDPERSLVTAASCTSR